MRLTPSVLGLTLAASLAAADAKPVLGDLRKVGEVRLSTSCRPAVQKDLDRAVALLHSFFYDEARRVFGEAAAKDPACAMAEWGIAMTWWHPIWTPPSPDEMDAGKKAAERAQSIGGKTEPEKKYIGAVAAYYGAPATTGGEGAQTCHGPAAGGHQARAKAYEKAMEAFFAAYPDDVEVGTFYALALLGTAPPTDKTLANQKKATEILERFQREHPDHPGIVHYLIHGYDYPPVAAKGLPAARAYADIAPWVPHALHMPSHIFTRLGMWKEVVESNLASADASRQYAALRHPGATSFEELHALDYTAYGYLQMADDAAAKGAVGHIERVTRTFPETDFVSAYARGAVPARYALERRQWEEAAALTVPNVPMWKSFPFGEAHLVFARALGAARAGRPADAAAALARLLEVGKSITDSRHAYFAKHVDMQATVVKGWIAAAKGDAKEAEALLRAAAEQDDTLGKHPVSPGSILPARELLADFLYEQKRFAEAQAEYEACLTVNPRRLGSVYGAGRAAEAQDRKEDARRHYEALVAMVVPGASRAEVRHAREFLAPRKAQAAAE
jgi:tetratricopeptide (TPR) repeat protein